MYLCASRNFYHVYLGRSSRKRQHKRNKSTRRLTLTCLASSQGFTFLHRGRGDPSVTAQPRPIKVYPLKEPIQIFLLKTRNNKSQIRNSGFCVCISGSNGGGRGGVWVALQANVFRFHWVCVQQIRQSRILARST